MINYIGILWRSIPEFKQSFLTSKPSCLGLSDRPVFVGKSIPGNGRPKMTSHEAELAKLRKELADVRMECDILKKAITIYSSSDRKGSRS